MSGTDVTNAKVKATSPLRIAVVAIGRNEGVRFEVCARSVTAQTDRFIYVDSGSTDGSVAFAEGQGAEVVALDMSRPFTAARARNEGFARALAVWPDTDMVQFIDGDCELAEGWLGDAARLMAANPAYGIVTGWNRERFPDRSVYNRMCDLEWAREEGEVEACGGIMMVRAQAFRAAGGFDEAIIAAEDDEFCVRVRERGFKVFRLGRVMSRHDAEMTRFSQWWRRAVRAGHGYAQVGTLHPDYFRAERRRSWLWGAGVPAAALFLGLVWWPLGLAVLGLYAVSYFRTRSGLMKSGTAPDHASLYARFLTLAKFPNLLGILTYRFRAARGRDAAIIEYK